MLDRLTLFILIAYVAVGCSAPGTQSESLPTQARQAEENERTLVLWTHDFPTLTAGLQEKWIPEFEAAHPGVTVEYHTFLYSGSIVAFDTKLLAEVSSGGGPDVWAMASHNFTQAQYIEAGLIAPLDLDRFGYSSLDEVVAEYPENGLSVFIRDGEIYALLNELTTLCLYYNQSVFDEAGLQYLPADRPVSWQNIGEIGQQLYLADSVSGRTKRMGFQFGFFANYPSPEWYAQNFYPLMRQYGQDDLFIHGVPAADREPVAQALQIFYDFTHTYKAYDPYFIKDWFSEFPQGRIGMVIAGPWFTSAIRVQNPDVRFGVAPHPVIDPQDQTTYRNIMYSFGWVVNANRAPAKQALAQEFLAFILGKKGDTEQPLWWFEQVGVIQPSEAFLQSPGFRQALAQEPWMNCFIDTFGTYQVDYYQHSSDEAGTALKRAINRVVYDKMYPNYSAELLQNELQLLP